MSSADKYFDIIVKGFSPKFTLNPSAIEIGGNCG